MSLTLVVHYIEKTIIVALPIFISLCTCRYIYLHRVDKLLDLSWKKEIALQILILYLLCLYQITAIRFGLTFSVEKMVSRSARINFIPMTLPWKWLIYGYWSLFISNVIGNCLWFIPLGVLLPALYTRQRKLWRVMLIGALVSISIEGLQYLLCTGVTDIDDVILNTLGSIMGYLLWRIIRWIQSHFKKPYK